MNLHMGRGHVDVGGKDRDQEQGEAPTGQELNLPSRNQQSGTAQQFENAADLNAGQWKGNPGRHDWKKEHRIAQMDRAGEEEERGEEQANESAKDQAGTLTHFGKKV